MKHKLLFVIAALIFISTNSDAQVKRKGTSPLMHGPRNQKQVPFKAEQFLGKWQEIIRINSDDKTSAIIVDTIYLNFTDTGKVETREGNNPDVKGSYMIDVDSTLTAAGDVYTIKSINENEMVLDDNDKYIHTFKKTSSFWFEHVGKDSVKTESFMNPVSYSPEKLMGKWVVYKRNAKPGAISSSALIIKNLKITNKVNDQSASGMVTFFKEDESTELPCKIVFSKTSIQIEAGTNSWDLPVYKADGKEFVFGNPAMVIYFCKLAE